MRASTLTGKEPIADQWMWHILSHRGDWGQLLWETVYSFCRVRWSGADKLAQCFQREAPSRALRSLCVLLHLILANPPDAPDEAETLERLLEKVLANQEKQKGKTR